VDDRIQAERPAPREIAQSAPPVESYWSTIPPRRRVLACGLLAGVLAVLFPVSSLEYPRRTGHGSDFFGPYPALAHDPEVKVTVYYGSTFLGLLAVAGLTGVALLLLPPGKTRNPGG
jgi:hypothetical protein